MAKTSILNVKVEDEVKEQFEIICRENYSNPSQELYKFIRLYIKQNKGSKILLSEIKKY